MGGIADGPSAELVSLLHTEIGPVATVQDSIGIRVSASRGKKGAVQPGSSVINVVETRSLKREEIVTLQLCLRLPSLWDCAAQPCPERSSLTRCSRVWLRATLQTWAGHNSV